MAISPYALCPCGSGKQFKWCCQEYYSYVEKAVALHEKGQGPTAESMMAQMVAKFPNVPQAWGFQAEMFMLHEKLPEALAAVEKALSIDPNYATGYWMRGLLRAEDGDLTTALADLRQAADKFNPDLTEMVARTYTQIAEFELRSQHPIAAHAAIDRSLHLQPNQPELRESLKPVFGEQSRLPSAARKTYAYRPATLPGWDKTLELAATGKFSDALKAFTSLTEANPDDASAWFNLGLTQAWLGDNEKALDSIGRSLDLEMDPARAEESGGLNIVLRYGVGNEHLCDSVNHEAYFQFNDADAFSKFTSDLAASNRLLVLSYEEEQAMLSGMILERSPDLGDATPQLADLLTYVMVIENVVRIWSTNKSKLDAGLLEFRTKLGNSFGEPTFSIVPANFGDLFAELMSFPTRPGVDRSVADQKFRERAHAFFENTWLHQPLKSLSGQTPIDAAAHSKLKNRLPGLIEFMSDCLNVDMKGDNKIYNFDRLRRKLGLPTATPVGDGDLEIDTLDPAGLAALKAATLKDDQVGIAFRAAMKLDAGELAAVFANEAVQRATIADRYPYFSYLAKMAREEDKGAQVVSILADGEAADAATNGGNRFEDYALARAQAVARNGDTNAAIDAYRAAIAKAPSSLRLLASATETMLSKRQGNPAREFAEQGLKLARAQNNRDAEQQFLELSAAAAKT